MENSESQPKKQQGLERIVQLEPRVELAGSTDDTEEQIDAEREVRGEHHPGARRDRAARQLRVRLPAGRAADHTDPEIDQIVDVASGGVRLGELEHGVRTAQVLGGEAGADPWNTDNEGWCGKTGIRLASESRISEKASP